MILGNFGEVGELMFEIEIISADEDNYPIEVLLDTGFTNGWLALDIQDAEILGWPLIERNSTMRMARGEAFFDIYEGKVKLDGQEYIIPVLAAEGISEPLLGLQWLKILPLSVNFSSGILTLG
ncbi:aspartyl protease [Dolichospermum sp. UHCC 0684]|jgi:predicted aspartyl protease|uniref:Aspartyl protease n=2 Tax=Aphanizomenonaceae TaxID=1892259 RepID=A0A1B7VGV9_APHFL|nr:MULTISPECIES: aspartyl protease [unclassified Dolichospermum]MBO1045144.1 aspartyl protease [Aphanizomenon flos-aquae UKL13-PB]OBQ17236.1 MAG: aspartyl protease [Aphanizomenon flos-aquae LD13]HCQ20996.1 aspartyl protease [Anabaena sp. UBA12330]MEA5528680.1 aspartyl protease [Dolichospermum sp. UHCC 0684]MTJ36794.1 aspartyl protease [Dolichospermum sp. UHCC 0260]